MEHGAGGHEGVLGRDSSLLCITGRGPHPQPLSKIWRGELSRSERCPQTRGVSDLCTTVHRCPLQILERGGASRGEDASASKPLRFVRIRRLFERVLSARRPTAALRRRVCAHVAMPPA